MCFRIKSSQVFLGVLTFCVVNGFPLEQFYSNTNNNDPLAYQGFSYYYEPRSVYFYPNDINKPVFYPQLGMSPQYHDLVYNYVKDFAGTEPPAHVNTFHGDYFNNGGHFVQQASTPANFENVGAVNEDKVATGSGNKDSTPGGATSEQITDKPGFKDYFLPSDLFSTVNNPSNQYHGQFDAIKTKTVNAKARPTSLPPIGGVISNYALFRTQPNQQNLLHFPGTFKENEANLQHIKRQIPDNSDGVVILAAEPSQNGKASEENSRPKEESTEANKEEEQEMEAHPGIAQSKPSAIALAGPGGIAQASPVGTALVGQGGLAVAAPSGTAVAGPGGQGIIPIQPAQEKQKPTEKTEESDSY